MGYNVCYCLTEDGTPYFSYEAYIFCFLFHNPSECRMFIPGTYAEMLEDYE